MKILITNQNIEWFKSIKKNLKIEPSTKSTSIISVTTKTFEKFRDEATAQGINPYALMYW